jgi:hypothetical protein
MGKTMAMMMIHLVCVHVIAGGEAAEQGGGRCGSEMTGGRGACCSPYRVHCSNITAEVLMRETPAVLLLLLLQDVPATVMEYTTTDISAALSIAGVQVKSGSSKRVSSSDG